MNRDMFIASITMLGQWTKRPSYMDPGEIIFNYKPNGSIKIIIPRLNFTDNTISIEEPLETSYFGEYDRAFKHILKIQDK